MNLFNISNVLQVFFFWIGPLLSLFSISLSAFPNGLLSPWNPLLLVESIISIRSQHPKSLLISDRNLTDCLNGLSLMFQYQVTSVIWRDWFFTKLPWLQLSSIAHVVMALCDLLSLTGTTHFLILSSSLKRHNSLKQLCFLLLYSLSHLALVYSFPNFLNQEVLLGENLHKFYTSLNSFFFARFWGFFTIYCFAASIKSFFLKKILPIWSTVRFFKSSH